MRLLFRIGPIVFVTGLLVVLFAQSDPAEKSARAVLEAKCAACHGPARMSGLDLRERDTILKGGKRGPAIVPGKADESLLYKAVRREGELQMPPGKAALSRGRSERHPRLDQRRRSGPRPRRRPRPRPGGRSGSRCGPRSRR